MLIKSIYMKYFIFGRGRLVNFAIDHLLRNNLKNIFVIPEVPEPKWMDSVFEHCKKRNIKVIDFKDIYKYMDRNSVGYSIYFSKIFKQDLISSFNYLVNLHNGPLPKYRGVNPVNWALKNNETSHGVTLHHISEGVDSGDIIDQEFFNINQKLEVIDLYNMCLDAGEKILARSMLEIDKIIPKKQNEEIATMYTKKDFYKLGERKYFTIEESTNYQ